MKTKWLLLALTAVLALSIGAGTASANRSLAVEPGGAILAEGPLTFSSNAGRDQIISSVTLHGSLHRELINKLRGELVGFITGVLIELCRTNREGTSCVVRSNLRLPWHIRYEGFRGTLPNITGILLLLEGFFLIEARAFGFPVWSCLYGGPIFGLTNGPSVTTLTVDAEQNVPRLVRLAGECPAEGILSGTMRVRPTQRLRLH